jgi:hypothetical protein
VVQPPICGYGVQTEIQGLVGTPLCMLPRGSQGVELLSPKVWNGCHGGEDLAIGIACFTTPPPLTGDQTHTHTHTCRVRTHFGSFVLVTLVCPHSSNKVRVASNHSVLSSCQDSLLPCHGSVLLSFLLGG